MLSRYGLCGLARRRDKASQAYAQSVTTATESDPQRNHGFHSDGMSIVVRQTWATLIANGPP